MTEELRVFVGCTEAQWLPFAVLRHSIMKRTRQPVRIEPLFEVGTPIPVPRETRNRQKTPFSFQRFTIPAAMSYQGKAVYLDSDMLVFDDIAELFERDFGDANVLGVPTDTSVLVLNCESLPWRIHDLVADLDAGKLSYDALMKCRSIAKIDYCLPGKWNWLDISADQMPRSTALLHFTLTTSQPWLTSGHRLGHLWLQELFDALDAGAIRPDDVESAVARGFVRPSLRYQVERRISSRSETPPEVLEGDKRFADYCRSVNFHVVDGLRS